MRFSSSKFQYHPSASHSDPKAFRERQQQRAREVAEARELVAAVPIVRLHSRKAPSR